MSSLAAPRLDSPAWLSHHHRSLPAGPGTLATPRAVRGHGVMEPFPGPRQRSGHFTSMDNFNPQNNHRGGSALVTFYPAAKSGQ